MKMKKSASRRKSAPSPKFEDDDFMDDDMCSTDGSNAPVPRNTANARERARMRVLSGAFYRLKTIIPWVPHDTKLSKLDTLRLAKNYISYLTATLEGQPVDEITNKLPQPQKMTWPYIFQQVPEIGKKKSSQSQKKEQNPSVNNYSNCYSTNSVKPLYEQPVYVPSVSNRNSFTHQLASNDSLVLLYN